MRKQPARLPQQKIGSGLGGAGQWDALSSNGFTAVPMAYPKASILK
jgi:hypothetical protein